ncbi:MAG: hypothetical protein ACP5E4_02330 [Candidatus Aenigmatarchaeota archaeon]
MRSLLHLLAAFLLCALPAQAFSIGTAPGVQYVGDFSPGDSVYVKFYLLTNARSDILTTLTYMRPHLEMYYPNSIRMVSAYETSQEDISQWIKFQQNPILVSPRKTIVATLEGGEVVKANAEAVYKLTIPKDAEPGYHVGSVGLSPKVTTGTGGTGIATIGITRYIFVFKVRGVAERVGEIQNVFAQRVDADRARIDVIFRNTGKDTVSVWVDDMEVYDEFGNLVDTLDSGISYVAPGETKILPVYWPARNVSGTYKADAKVNYITGYAAKAVTIEIPKEISKPSFERVTETEFPWWLLLLLALLVILIIYWKY